MRLPDRPAQLRQTRRLAQQVLAEQVGLHVMQIHRYEAGTSQPTLDVIRRLFEAVSQFSREDKKAAKALLDALILKQQARRWTDTG